MAAPPRHRHHRAGRPPGQRSAVPVRLGVGVRRSKAEQCEGVTGHDETVRREFAKQAATFEDPDYSFADRRLMAWIESNVPAEPDAAVLDVAGGTGHMGRAYARTSAVAVVLDLTEEMLATGQARAKAAGQGNVVFMRGDAARMELIDESFDLVLSRFAVHHFARPEQQIA